MRKSDFICLLKKTPKTNVIPSPPLMHAKAVSKGCPSAFIDGFAGVLGSAASRGLAVLSTTGWRGSGCLTAEACRIHTDQCPHSFVVVSGCKVSCVSSPRRLTAVAARRLPYVAVGCLKVCVPQAALEQSWARLWAGRCVRRLVCPS